MYTRKRKYQNDPVPADWDICHIKGETLYRCPEFIIISGTGEIRRCSICKKKSKWKEHLSGCHKYDIPEKDDDPYLIERVKERVILKEESNDFNICQHIINSVAMITGQIDIPISKTSSNNFRQFVNKILKIGMEISKMYPNSNPDLNRYTVSLTPKKINTSMQLLSILEFEKRLKLFQNKIFINVLCDAGTVLGYKCIHAMLGHPGINDVIPFEIFENHEFNGDDYSQFFNEVFDKAFQNKLFISSVIIDNLPSQMNGIYNLINSSENPMIKSIIVVPCLCHLTNLIFTTSIRRCANIKRIVTDIQSFVTQIRKPDAVNFLKLKCPKIIVTRWLYVVDCLKFIFDYSDSLYAGRRNGYEIPIIPIDFYYLYDILIPIKVLNLLAERRDSRLYCFVQYFHFAIKSFLNLYEKYQDNNCALEILNEITIQFYARIKTWSGFSVMVTAYLCTPEGKQHAKLIFRDRFINPDQNIDFDIPEQIIINPSFNEIKTEFDDPELFTKIRSLQQLYEMSDQDDDEFIISKNKHKNTKLVQKKLTDYIYESESNIVNNIEYDKNISCEEEINDDNDVYLEEVENQRLMSLQRRLNQGVFLGKKTTIFKIAKDFLIEYSNRLGFTADIIMSYFEKWLYSPEDELSFGSYSKIGCNIDNLWENAGTLDFEWSMFASVAKRLTTIGSSEADVERLFSQQKVVMGRHMTNIGSDSLKSRLILRTSK